MWTWPLDIPVGVPSRPLPIVHRIFSGFQSHPLQYVSTSDSLFNRTNLESQTKKQPSKRTPKQPGKLSGSKMVTLEARSVWRRLFVGKVLDTPKQIPQRPYLVRHSPRGWFVTKSTLNESSSANPGASLQSDSLSYPKNAFHSEDNTSTLPEEHPSYRASKSHSLCAYYGQVQMCHENAHQIAQKLSSGIFSFIPVIFRKSGNAFASALCFAVPNHQGHKKNGMTWRNHTKRVMAFSRPVALKELYIPIWFPRNFPQKALGCALRQDAWKSPKTMGFSWWFTIVLSVNKSPLTNLVFLRVKWNSNCYTLED